MQRAHGHVGLRVSRIGHRADIEQFHLKQGAHPFTGDLGPGIDDGVKTERHLADVTTLHRDDQVTRKLVIRRVDLYRQPGQVFLEAQRAGLVAPQDKVRVMVEQGAYIVACQRGGKCAGRDALAEPAEIFGQLVEHRRVTGDLGRRAGGAVEAKFRDWKVSLFTLFNH